MNDLGAVLAGLFVTIVGSIVALVDASGWALLAVTITVAIIGGMWNLGSRFSKVEQRLAAVEESVRIHRVEDATP
jgi:hypothetical protein